MSKYNCIGCGDTGINSKGGACFTCVKNGRNVLADNIKHAVGIVCESAIKREVVPSEEELLKAIRWAKAPRFLYAMGYRDSNGEMRMVAGPTPRIENIIDDITPDDDSELPAYIVSLEKTEFKGEPIMQPVAKWVNDKWVFKRKEKP